MHCCSGMSVVFSNICRNGNRQTTDRWHRVGDLQKRRDPKVFIKEATELEDDSFAEIFKQLALLVTSFKDPELAVDVGGWSVGLASSNCRPLSREGKISEHILITSTMELKPCASGRDSISLHAGLVDMSYLLHFGFCSSHFTRCFLRTYEQFPGLDKMSA